MKTRLLVDRCLGRKIVDWLVEQGHDAVHASVYGEVDPGDPKLLAFAVQDQRIVVTADADFGTLIFVRRLPHAGLIRIPDVPLAKKQTMLAEVFSEHADALRLKAVITVTESRIRVSFPPTSSAS